MMGNTDLLAKQVVGHGLDGASVGLLDVLAKHWGLDTSGMNPRQLQDALEAHPRYAETKRAVEEDRRERERLAAMAPADRPIEPGSFTEEHPYPRLCGRGEEREDHPAHKERLVLTRHDGSRYHQWTGCPGWETTHVLTLTEAGGRVVKEERLDLRGRLDYSGSTNDPVLTMLYEADAAGQPRPSDDELLFGVAGAMVAPEVCPWDSDRCHEHLYGLAERLEEEGEGP